MIRIEGSLIVKKIRQSRNGPFCVADLITEVGEFKVKDPVLDQFAEGEYRGVFWISEIYLSPYVSFGRGVMELRARLHDLQLVSDGAPIADDLGGETEPDPIDEAPPTRVNRKQIDIAAKHPPLKVGPKPKTGKPPGGVAADKQDSPPPPRGSDFPTDSSSPADGELFGEEIAAAVASRSPIRLDPTIDDRARFRGQTARLRELGYNFDPKSQTWTPKA